MIKGRIALLILFFFTAANINAEDSNKLLPPIPDFTQKTEQKQTTLNNTDSKEKKSLSTNQEKSFWGSMVDFFASLFGSSAETKNIVENTQELRKETVSLPGSAMPQTQVQKAPTETATAPKDGSLPPLALPGSAMPQTQVQKAPTETATAPKDVSLDRKSVV